MAVAIQYGTATPSLGDPLLELLLRAHYVVGESSPIVQAIRGGDYAAFRQLLTDRKVTPFDEVITDEKVQTTLFARVTWCFCETQLLADNSSKPSALLQMAQLLVESGVDCGQCNPLAYLIVIKEPHQAELMNTLARLVLSRSKSDPFSTSWYWMPVQRNLKALIMGQDEWDTTAAMMQIIFCYGRGAWQRVMVEKVDKTVWRLEQSVAWRQEPCHVRHSIESCRIKYGVWFCSKHRYLVKSHSESNGSVCQWLRLRWRELKPSVRHSFPACREELGEVITEHFFNLLCTEESWKEEPREVKVSREETQKRYGWDFVADLWNFSSWQYLLAEERYNIYSELGGGTKADEICNKEDRNPIDASSADDGSSDTEYDIVDEG